MTTTLDQPYADLSEAVRFAMVELNLQFWKLPPPRNGRPIHLWHEHVDAIIDAVPQVNPYSQYVLRDGKLFYCGHEVVAVRP